MLPGVPSRTNGTNNVNKSKRLQVPVCQGPGRVCRMITHQDHLNSFKSPNYDFGAFGLATQSEPGDARFFGPFHDQKAVHQCTSAATCTYTTLHSHSLPLNSLHIPRTRCKHNDLSTFSKSPTWTRLRVKDGLHDGLNCGCFGFCLRASNMQRRTCGVALQIPPSRGTLQRKHRQ